MICFNIEIILSAFWSYELKQECSLTYRSRGNLWVLEKCKYFFFHVKNACLLPMVLCDKLSGTHGGYSTGAHVLVIPKVCLWPYSGCLHAVLQWLHKMEKTKTYNKRKTEFLKLHGSLLFPNYHPQQYPSRLLPSTIIQPQRTLVFLL